MRAAPPEGGRTDLPDHLLPSCLREHDGHYDVLGRMRWDQPAPTLRVEHQNPTKGRYTHPSEHRVVSVWEAARIQGYPDDYTWTGTRADVVRQIGNSVPVPLAAAIGAAVARHAGIAHSAATETTPPA